MNERNTVPDEEVARRDRGRDPEVQSDRQKRSTVGQRPKFSSLTTKLELIGARIDRTHR